MFYDSFMQIFTPKEQASEMVKQVAAIGHMTEVELLAEIRSILNSSLDFANRNEDQLRSMLAFFYVPVRNFTQSVGVAQYTDQGGTAPYLLEKGRQIVANNGVLFYTTQEQFVNPQQSYIIPIAQGRSQSFSGPYNEFIQVSAPGADLDTISLVINGKTIPKVLFNGLVASNAYAAQGTPTSPTNGYFAVYYNDTLYIKVYEGPDVPAFKGEAYSLSLYVCDGPSGNILYDSLSGLVSPPVDGNGFSPSYSLINDPVTGGLSAPPKSELLATLLYWMFTKNNVSAISDFQRWFLKYPGVLDVSVNGDSEDYAATGILNVTGRVRVAPVMFQSGSTSGRVPTSDEFSAMETELAKVRDAGITQYLSYGITQHRLTCRYISVQSEGAFQAAVNSALTNLYDVNYGSANSFSLFTDLDLVTITDKVPFDLNPVGLEILYEFFKSVPILTQSTIALNAFFGSKVAPGTTIFTLIPDSGSTLVYTEIATTTQGRYNIVDSALGVRGYHQYPTSSTPEYIQISMAAGALFTGSLEMVGTPRSKTNFTSGDRNSIRQIKPWTSVPSNPDDSVVSQSIVGNVLFVKYNP